MTEGLRNREFDHPERQRAIRTSAGIAAQRGALALAGHLALLVR